MSLKSKYSISTKTEKLLNKLYKRWDDYNQKGDEAETSAERYYELAEKIAEKITRLELIEDKRRK